MSIADKLTQIAENEQKVYDKGIEIGRAEGYENGKTDGIEIGKKAEYDAFWDGFTDNGNRTDYYQAFRRWGNEYIRPNIKIIPTVVDSSNQTFNKCNNLKKIEAQYFDFSQKPIGTKSSESYYYTFSTCKKLEEIEDIGMQADFGYECAFAYCDNLRTIAKIRSKEETIFTDAFRGDYELKNVTFDDVIGQDINFKWSTKLSANSMRSIITHLSDTASGKTLTLSKTAKQNAVWDDVVSITGTCSGEDFYSNPISVPLGYKLKVELIVDDGHYIETPTWDDSKYQSWQEDPNCWTIGLWNTWDDYSPNNRSYIIEGGTDHTVRMYFTRYTANEKPATFSVRAVLVDNDGNEVGENLFSAVEVEGVVTNEGGWESLKASKPNWTISLV